MLALGSGLKNTVCWLKDGVAVMSQHLGDLDSAAALHAFERTVEVLGSTLKAVPDVIAVDAHPDNPTATLAGVWPGNGVFPFFPYSIIRRMCLPAPQRMELLSPPWA